MSGQVIRKSGPSLLWSWWEIQTTQVPATCRKCHPSHSPWPLPQHSKPRAHLLPSALKSFSTFFIILLIPYVLHSSEPNWLSPERSSCPLFLGMHSPLHFSKLRFLSWKRILEDSLFILINLFFFFLTIYSIDMCYTKLCSRFRDLERLLYWETLTCIDVLVNA